MSDKSVILMITGPSGVGKTTLSELLVEKLKGQLVRAVSSTSRPPRPGEEEGVDYFFISRDEITTEVEKGNALNHLFYHGNTYAYLRDTFEGPMSQGLDLVAVATKSGVEDLKAEYGDLILSILLVPPSLSELERRLRKDGRTEETIQRRLESAEEEMQGSQVYDVVVVCDELEVTLDTVLRLYREVKGN